MIINTANLSTIFTAYNAAFKEGFSQAKPTWEQIATMVPSSTETNLYAWLGQFPKLREWLGSRVVKNMATFDYSLTNKPFEATVGVDRDKIEDDVFGVFTPLMQEMGYSAGMHPDELVFTELLAGATNLCYDGQAFFDTSHPTVVSGVASTSSNYDATGGGNMWCLMDTTHPLKPLLWQKRREYNFVSLTQPRDPNVVMDKEFIYGVDSRSVPGYGLWQMAYGSLNTLNATNFDAAVTAMMSLKSNEDKPLGIRPNLLVCGPSNRAAARALIEVQLTTAGATNPNYKEVDVLVSQQMV